MSKKLLFVCVLAVCCLVITRPAYAHVLITDDTKQTGAVLHVTPDDDPIAGQSSTLMFDVQKNSISAATLTVKDDAGQQTKVATNISKGMVSANYTFPTQGVYDLTLTITAARKDFVFHYPQRVSRGTLGSALDLPQYDWAQVLLIGSVCGFLLLVIVAINRWREIGAQSK